MTQELPDSPVRAVRWTQSAAVLEVAGDIDLNTSPGFLQAVLAALDKRPGKIVINLGSVPYMDSSGVASLVKVLSRARRSGVQLILVEMTDRVRGVFEITRLETVFDILLTEAEALA